MGDSINYIFYVIPEKKIELIHNTSTSFYSLCYQACSHLGIDPEAETYLLNYYPVDQYGKRIMVEEEPQEQLPF